MKNDQRDNGPKSKNRPHGKKGEVTIDWGKCLGRRRAEGANRSELMPGMACNLAGA